MDMGYTLLVLAGVGAFFMAFCNGANDVANAFASAVGAKALKMKTALFIASIVTFLGAVFLGGHVVSYIIDGLAPASMFTHKEAYIIAMIAVLISAGIFVLLSTLVGMPVSSTHAIVGGLTGVSVLVEGWHAINWQVMTTIGLSWVISPFLAGGFAYLLVSLIRTFVIGEGAIGTLKRMRRRLPILISITLSCGFFGILVRPKQTALLADDIPQAAIISLLLLVPFYIQSKFLMKRLLKKCTDNAAGAEKAFKKLQIATSSYVAFGNGSNDVSNSITPVFAIYLVIKHGDMIPASATHSIPFWIMALGGVGIAMGITFLGKKVMKTLGKNLTTISNMSGFSIDFSVASVVLSASLLGLPVSTSQAATGAIVGAGLSKSHDMHSVQYNVLTKILISWVLTVPLSALISVGLYQVLAVIFL